MSAEQLAPVAPPHHDQEHPADRDRDQPLGDPEQHHGGGELLAHPRPGHARQDADVGDLGDADGSRRDRDQRHDPDDRHRRQHGRRREHIRADADAPEGDLEHDEPGELGDHRRDEPQQAVLREHDLRALTKVQHALDDARRRRLPDQRPDPLGHPVEPAAQPPREALRPHDGDQQDRGGDQHDEADQGEQERTGWSGRPTTSTPPVAIGGRTRIGERLEQRGEDDPGGRDRRSGSTTGGTGGTGWRRPSARAPC